MNIFKNYYLLFLLFILATQTETSSAASQTSPKAPVRLLFTRAGGENASLKEIENSWFSAVLDGYYHLRFMPFKENFIFRDNYKKFLSYRDDFGKSVPENVLFRVAGRLNATHILMHMYSIENYTINYFLEVVSIDKKKVVMSFDKSFPFENLEQNLIDCSSLLIEKVGLSHQKESLTHIKRPILGSDMNSLESIGDLIIEYDKGNAKKTAEKFLKIIKKNPTSALAVYMAVLSHKGIRDYKQTPHLLYHLIIRNGFRYPQLYLESIQHFRLNKSNDYAQRLLKHAQQHGLNTPELLLEQAKIHEGSKDFKKTSNVYKQVLKADPKQPEALLHLSRQKREKGLHKESLDILDSLKSPKINRGKVNLEKGENLIALGKYKEALQVILSAYRTLPDDPRVNELLGDLRFRFKKYRDAVVFYKKAFKFSPRNLKLLFKITEAYKKSNSARQALDFLNKHKEDFYSSSKLITKEIGLIKFLLKDTANALSILETCINLEPPDSNVYLVLGDIYMSKGSHENAISMFLRAEHLVKDNVRIKRALSNLYFIQKNYFKAEQGFLSILSINPKYPGANQSLGDIHFAKGSIKNALQYYLKERRYHRSNAHIQKMIGQIYYKLKKYTDADVEFRKAITMAPYDPFAYYQLTRIALKQKKGDKAREYFEKGETKGKADIRISTYKEIGDGFARIGSFNHAIKSYKKGFQLDPKNEEILINLGKVYKKAGRDNETAQIYLKVYTLNKTTNESYLADAGHIFFKKGRKAEANKIYTELIEKGYRKPDISINLATMEFEKKKYDKVIPLLTNLDKKKLAEKKIASMLAFSYYNTDNYKFAIPHFTILLKNSPSKEIIEMAAISYEKTDQLPLAISMYKKFLTFGKTDKHKKYASHIAILYEKQNDLASAKTQYIKNISDYPSDIQNYYKLVTILIKDNMNSQAISYLKKATEIPSCPPEFFKKLSELYIKEKNEKEAAVVLQKYLTLKPNDTDALLTVGSIYYSNKSFYKAIAPLEKYHNLHPNDTTCLNMLAPSYINTNNVPKAISIYNKIINKNPNNERMLIDLGKIYKKVGRDIEATRVYIKIYNLNKTKNGSYLADAGHIYFKKGKKEAAYKAYNELIEKGYRKPDVAKNLATMEFEKRKYERVIPLLTNLDKKKIAEKEIASMLAFSYYYTDNYKFAIPHINILLEKSPSKEIVEMAAVSYEKTEQLPKAISMYKKFLSFEKTAQHKKYANHIAVLYEKQNDFSSAKAQYIKNITNYPDYFQNYAKLIKILVKENMYSQAILYLKKATGKPSCPPEFFKKLSELYIKEKNKKEAAVVLQKYLLLKPGETDVLLKIGSLYHSSKLFSKAIIPLEKYHSLRPNDTTCLNKLLSSYINTGNTSKVISTYNKIIIKNPNNENALLRLSKIFKQDKKMVEVAKIYLKLFQINKSKNNSYLLKAGHIYYNLNMYPEASKHYSMFLYGGYKNTKAAINLASIEFMNRNYERVITLLKGLPDKYISEKGIIKQIVVSYKNTGKGIEALPYLNRLIKKDPRDIENIKLAAIIFEKNGDLASAVTMHKKYLALPKTILHKDYAYHLAELYEKQNLKSLAISQYSKNMTMYPNDLRNYEKLSLYYEKVKKYDQAVIILTKAKKIPSAPPEITKRLADVLVLQKKNARAALEYENYVRKVSNDHEAWYSLGSIYYSQKKYKKALQPLEKALSLKPSNESGLYKLGHSYIKTNLIKSAIKPLLAALKFTENNTKILKLLTLCYIHEKDTASLISVMQKRTDIARDDFEFYFQLGDLLLKTNKKEQAIQSFEKAIKIKPKNISTHLNLIKLYTEVKNREKLISQIDQVLHVDPTNVHIHYKKALYHIAYDEILYAKASLKKTIQLKPKHHAAHFKYAQLLEKEENYKTAYIHYNKAANHDEKNIEYLITLARVSDITGKVSNAVKVINKALKLKPGDSKVVQFAGYVYYKSGQYEKAADLLLKGLELDENCTFCNEILGTLYYRKKEYVKASRYLEKACQLSNNNDTILLQYANTLYFQGKYTQAKDYFSQAFTRNPENDIALYRLCEMYLLEGEISKAELVIQNNKRDRKSGWIHLTEARVYEESNKLNAAFKSYIQAFKSMPDNLETLKGLGSVSILQKKYNAAIKYYSKAMTLQPDDTDIFLGMGKAFYHMKNYAAAMELFNEVTRIPNNDVELYHVMALTYSKLKKHNAAIKVLKKGLRIKARDADLQFTLGNELGNSSQFQESIDSYLKAIKYDKTKAIDGYLAIGNIYYFKLNSTKNAKRYYTKYIKAGGTDSKIKSILAQLQTKKDIAPLKSYDYKN